MSDKRIEGTWPIIATPMTADEEIDEEGMRRVVDYEADAGVDGLWMMGARGEGPNLRERIVRRALEVAVDQSKNRGIRVVTGCGAPGTQQTIENVRVAEDCGVDMVHITEPYYYKLDGKPYGERELWAHYEAVADAARVPVVIYFDDSKWPGITPGRCPEPIKKLAAHPNIAGIKASVGDQRILQSLVWETEDVGHKFGIMITFGHMAFAGLVIGCHGTTAPAAAIAPKMFVDMYIATKGGDLERALTLQRQVIPLCNAIRGFDAPSTKVAFAALGLCEEHLSMPLQPMIEPHRTQLIEMVKSGDYY